MPGSLSSALATTYFGRLGCDCDGAPLATGREGGATATDEPAVPQLTQHARRSERNGLAQRGVAAVDAVVVEAVGIDHAHTTQQHQSGIAVLWQRPLVTGADLDAGRSARLDDQRCRRPFAQPKARAGVLVVGHHRSVHLAGDVDAAMDDRTGSGFEREQIVEAGHAEDLGRCHVDRRRQMS